MRAMVAASIRVRIRWPSRSLVFKRFRLPAPNEFLGGFKMSTAATYERDEPVLPVYSRISWGAIFAGAFVAFAVYFLLNLLGAAVGLSVGDKELGAGEAIWAIIVMLLSLFIGGMTVTRCTVGETRIEGLVYGAVLWGVLFSGLMLMMFLGLTMGFGAMAASAARGGNVPETAAAAADRGINMSSLARLGNAAGLSAEQMDRLAAAARNPRNTTAANAVDVQNANENARTATWWTFVGTLLSMAAAIGGAMAGAATHGYHFRLTRVETVTARRARPAT